MDRCRVPGGTCDCRCRRPSRPRGAWPRRTGTFDTRVQRIACSVRQHGAWAFLPELGRQCAPFIRRILYTIEFPSRRHRHAEETHLVGERLPETRLERPRLESEDSPCLFVAAEVRD